MVKGDCAWERVPLLVSDADSGVAVYSSDCPRPQVRASYLAFNPDGAVCVLDDYLVADLVVRHVPMCIGQPVAAFC